MVEGQLVVHDCHDPWGSIVRFAQLSPHGPFQRCDLFLARRASGGQAFLALLVDGSPGMGANRPANVRRHLFETVAPLWSKLETLSALEFLSLLDDEFRRKNSAGMGRMYASAVAVRVLVSLSDVDVAEVGHTKAWCVEGGIAHPLWTEGLPRKDHRVEGALGTPRAVVRTQRVQLEGQKAIAVMTDGAYEVLVEQGLRMPDGMLHGELEAAFTAGGPYARDDATLVVLSGIRWSKV